MKSFCTILLVLSLASIAIGNAISPRINGGIPVDTFRRFPHHVSIIVKKITGEIRNCSGSIINEKWILSSISCLNEAERISFSFNRLSKHSNNDFTISINNATVQPYPTQYDDICLVQLPISLTFSEFVQPIKLSTNENLDNQFAVMPGFNNYDDRLSYGMFRVTTSSECKNVYKNFFDEFLQICTQGWQNNKQTPCEGNEGSGLIIGWPKNPELIGVFSTPLSCESQEPAIYMKVPKYLDWINLFAGQPSTFAPAK